RQQRNEIMQSFFAAVNNLSKIFYPSTRCQPPRTPIGSYHLADQKPASLLLPHRLDPCAFRFRFSAASCSEGRILETFPRLGNTFVVTSE
ncbi:hypothetical protein, partial [Ralstonia pseudosolanacearum]|uniref:hypothetical protein n=1 Tax=Ralstonia pseudosolanacearum TaxID=1310165 RepID=UPI003AAC541F